MCVETLFAGFEKKDAIQRQTLFANSSLSLWQKSVMKPGISREVLSAPTETVTVQNTDKWVQERHNTAVGRAFPAVQPSVALTLLRLWCLPRLNTHRLLLIQGTVKAKVPYCRSAIPDFVF